MRHAAQALAVQLGAQVGQDAALDRRVDVAALLACRRPVHQFDDGSLNGSTVAEAHAPAVPGVAGRHRQVQRRAGGSSRTGGCCRRPPRRTGCG